jgi:CDP-glucose 4,6-dehydratase
MLIDPQTCSGPWNFGPEYESHLSVKDLVEIVLKNYDDGRWIPKQAQASGTNKESSYLFLDISKAKSVLKWRPVLKISEAVKWTVDWYKEALSGSDMFEFGRIQISEFMNKWSSDDNH